VAISWHPFAGAAQVADASGNIVRSEYVYKIVVDLREQTEVSFVIPFVSITKYKQCYPGSDTDSYADQSSFCGMLCVSAITPLVCSTTIVPSSIQCLVECKAADDYEVAIPAEPFWTSIDTVLVNANTDSNWLELAEAQTGFASSGTRDIRSNYIDRTFKPCSITGDDRTFAYDGIYAEECIGEKINSISEMIKRPTYRGFFESLSYLIYPFNLYPTVYNWNSTTNKLSRVGNFQTNYLVSLSSMYAFFRGGLRYKFIVSNNNTNPSNLLEISLFSRSDPSWAPGDVKPGTLSQYPTHFENTMVKSISEVQVPYYSRVDTSIVGYVPKENLMTDAVTPNYAIRVASTKMVKGVYLSSASDDFRLGFFLGCPLAISTLMMSDYIDFNSVV
jgi:hypothetical protein